MKKSTLLESLISCFKYKNFYKKQKTFTLVELMVVIAIILILFALLLPTLKTAKMVAKQVRCIKNLQQIGQMTRVYASDYGNYFPSNNAPSSYLNPLPSSQGLQSYWQGKLMAYFWKPENDDWNAVGWHDSPFWFSNGHDVPAFYSPDITPPAIPEGAHPTFPGQTHVFFCDEALPEWGKVNRYSPMLETCFMTKWSATLAFETVCTTYTALSPWVGDAGQYAPNYGTGPVVKMTRARFPDKQVFALHGGATQATIMYQMLNKPVGWCNGSHCEFKFGMHSVIDNSPVVYIDGHVPLRTQDEISEEYTQLCIDVSGVSPDGYGHTPMDKPHPYPYWAKNNY